MDTIKGRRWANTLVMMIRFAMICNVIVLFFVPLAVCLSPYEVIRAIEERALHLLRIRPLGEDDIYIPMVMVALVGWGEILKDGIMLLHTALLAACGCCTYSILRQTRRILETVLAGDPFQMANANSLKRAAKDCWIISGAALLWLIVELVWLKGPAAWISYKTLLIPTFVVGGLLFWLMSALFYQAAQLQEDQNLTI